MKEFLASFLILIVLIGGVALFANRNKEGKRQIETVTVENPADKKLKEENDKIKKQLAAEKQLRKAEREYYQQFVVAYHACKHNYNCR